MLQLLDPDHPTQAFPESQSALDEPNGLIAMGGCLSPERLINAYRHGIFPWFNPGEPILWWTPDPRWILDPVAVKVSRSLKKRLDRNEFTFSFDRDFRAVMRGCAAPRVDSDLTWITDPMLHAYDQLHDEGYAHSFEVWQGGTLVGGLYGVAIGQVFFGESMFHRVTDASKAGLVFACRKLESWGYQRIDCQVYTPHLQSLGASEISRTQFMDDLALWVDLSPNNHAWQTQ